MAGHIITIIGGKGGVGKSMIAANLAYAYASETRSRVALFDFDSRACGDQNLIVGVKSKKTIKDLSTFAGSIDPRSIAPFLSNISGNVSFIGMPQDKVSAENIKVDSLGKTLKAITNIFPITVIDGGSDLGPLTLKALEYSTLIFLVVTPDILAINQTRIIYKELITMLFPKECIQVIFNQMQKGHPVTPEVAGKQIGKTIFGIVPKDDQTCVASLSRSKPIMLVAKNSNFAKGIIDVVRRIIQKNVLKSLANVNRSVKKLDGDKSEQVDSHLNKKQKNAWRDLKISIHRGLVDEMDNNNQFNGNDPKEMMILKEKTKKLIVELMEKEDTRGVVNNREDKNQLVKEILDEALGLGPLEDLLADPRCTEIMVSGPDKVFYEQDGKIRLSAVTFTTDRQVLQVIERIVAPIGRRIDEKIPYVDARLKDGSRVHAIIPPCAIDGCSITIRKFPEERFGYKDLVKFGSMTQEMADFLRIAVEGHQNIIVSGGTGSGKTTLINVLASFIQANERIITCEDSAELSLPQEHVIRLETKLPSLEGEGAVPMRDLIKNTLRMRPDRILVGECRGGEALDMLQAMGTGHDGSMTTVHSNNPRECIGRLETLVQYAGTGLGGKGIKEMIASSIHLIVQQARMDDGTRKITHISEISGIQGDIVTLQDIFLYSQDGTDKRGKIQGKFQATGFIPQFVEKLERQGYKIPRGIFTNQQEIEVSQDSDKKIKKNDQKLNNKNVVTKKAS